MEMCKDANVIGILVCKLAGDQTKDIISRMKQLCKINGKKSYIISVGKPNVAKLANFPEVFSLFLFIIIIISNLIEVKQEKKINCLLFFLVLLGMNKPSELY